MDALYLLQSAQQAGSDCNPIEPVSKWGANLSSAALVFFQSAENGATNVSVNDASSYFAESMRLQDPANLKCAFASILSIVRGNMYLYGSLSSPECLQFLMELLKFPDTSLVDKVAALLSGVMCRYPSKFTMAQVKMCADYQNASESGKMSVLANLLKNDAWRAEIFALHQMRILSGAGAVASVPTVYKSMMCLWLASFSPDVTIPPSVVVSVNELLKTSKAEKAVRMGLMCLENFLKKKPLCEAMAENETVSIVVGLEYEKWRDQELIELITRVKLALMSEVKILTNFERFEREIIVRTSRDAESLSVACHDLGEFARLHPIGKHILSSRGAKDKMLELMSSTQREVAREALLCVQKLMLNKSLDMVVA